MMLQNYAHAEGIHIENWKLFEDYFREMQERKRKGKEEEKRTTKTKTKGGGHQPHQHRHHRLPENVIPMKRYAQ